MNSQGARGREMLNKREAGRVVFTIFYYGLIVSLALAALRYSTGYWDSFFRGTSVLAPTFKASIYIAQGLCASAVLLLLRFRKAFQRNQARFILGVLSAAVLFLFLEMASLAYVCQSADESIQSRAVVFGQCGLQSRFAPHHYLIYYGTPGYRSPEGLDSHNSWGFRGPEIAVPKPEGVYRIAILGGSAAYTFGVNDWRKDFPRQLEAALTEKYGYEDIEAVNAALPGWNSWESLINLEFRVLDLKPDLILIYHGTNEVHARLVNPASYSGDNSGRRRLWGAGPTPLILRSNLVRLLTGINPGSYLSHFVDTDTTAAYTLQSGFSERLNATPLEALEANEPVYFERNLRNMIAIAREHDIDVLLATWAYSDEMGDYASTPHYGQGFAEINDVIRNVGLTHDVPVYDFAAEMPMAKEYWADGVHVNEAGARRMGELFAGFMDTHDLPGDRKT